MRGASVLAQRRQTAVVVVGGAIMPVHRHDGGGGGKKKKKKGGSSPPAGSSKGYVRRAVASGADGQTQQTTCRPRNSTMTLLWWSLESETRQAIEEEK